MAVGWTARDESVARATGGLECDEQVSLVLRRVAADDRGCRWKWEEKRGSLTVLGLFALLIALELVSSDGDLFAG